MRFWLLALLAAIGLAAPAAAQQQPSAELRAGAERVVELLRGRAEPAQIFTAEFLAAACAADRAKVFGRANRQSWFGRVDLRGVLPVSRR